MKGREGGRVRWREGGWKDMKKRWRKGMDKGGRERIVMRG
jgi:hypothetical protein